MMNEDTGEIREYPLINNDDFGKWSDPFKVGDIVEFKGIKLQIKKIKKLRGEIILGKTE